MWRKKLSELVSNGTFRTQDEIIIYLKTDGYDVTQASVSRELKARGIKKSNGYYVNPTQGIPAGIALVDARASGGSPLVVLRTLPANAPMLAQAVDRASLSGVMGTIAGDDTVFVACEDQQALSELSRWLGRDFSNVAGVGEEGSAD